MADQPLMIFISYARVDSEFVDRLDADLRARDYYTWVDRRRLEGGVEWEREINAAIADCDLFLISMSQSATDSPYVQHEFEQSQRLGKRIIPLLYQNFSPTREWVINVSTLNWVYFTDPKVYALKLKELLYAIQDPSLNLQVSDDALYSRAHAMSSGDPERAAVILQHLIDRTPNYFGGQAQQDLSTLEARLYASRAARLRDQAQQAQQQGEYGVEAASLEALMALGTQDKRVFDWAEEHLPTAKKNREMLGPYGVIQQLAEASNEDQARDLLQNLWKKAPYFRDPAHLAPMLGLTLPPRYEADKERERFREASALLRREISWVPPSSLGAVNEYGWKYRDAMRLDDARVALRRQDYDLEQPEAVALLDQMVKYQNRATSLMDNLNRVKTKPSRPY